MSNKVKGLFFIISAPSGAGKSTLIDEILKKNPGIKKTISFTTRAPRGEEKHGKDYFFVTKEEFEKMISAGELIEWAKVYDNYYGTSYKQISQALGAGQYLIKDLDTQGALILKEKLGARSVLIFVLPPSMEILRSRLTNRSTDSPQTIDKRLEEAAKEIQEAEKYHHKIINDEVETAIKELERIINGYLP